VSRVRTQLALKSARDRLKQLAEDKDELVGILAHDLKNHLGGMEMSAGLLRDRVSRVNDDRSARLAENILHSSSQLLSFVREFLANAAADHGITVQPTRLNLSEAAAAAVQQYQERARRKRLEFQTEFATENTCVQADPTTLRQVLDNLISNAVKFSPPDKHILVRVQPVDSHVECLIQDQGPGFTEEDRKKMFRRYGRLSARPTGGEPSSGLGLSIVRKLVLAMNGELNCTSVPGAGATFTIRLPSSPPQ
jgi:two-component system sensor histidine kinase/response regulator